MRYLPSLLCAVLLAPGITSAAAADRPSAEERIHQAVRQLAGSQRPSGLFSYGFDFLAGRPLAESHPGTIARQAGALYFLAEYFLHSRDESVRPVIEAGLAALGARSLPIRKAALQSLLERTGLFSLPVGRFKLRGALERFGLLYQKHGHCKLVSSDGHYETAFAGTTALALLAELQFAEASRDHRFRELRSAWLRGLLSLYVPRRGFRSMPHSIDEEDYFNGEGWLALAYYHSAFPGDPELQSVLEALDRYLMERYRTTPSRHFYHWGTMAAAIRYRTTAQAAFLRFIEQQTQWVLAAPWWRTFKDDNTCAVIEGLATAAAAVERAAVKDRGLLEPLHARINEEMEKNRQLQIPINAERLQFGEDTYLWSPTLKEHAGAFLEGRFRPNARLDVTGHCLSALVKLKLYGLVRG